MKDSNQKLAQKIYYMVKDRSEQLMQDVELIGYIENFISWQIDDALKMIKNINETSLNEKDRVNRLIELEQKYGIPKTHLL